MHVGRWFQTCTHTNFTQVNRGMSDWVMCVQTWGPLAWKFLFVVKTFAPSLVILLPNVFNLIKEEPLFCVLGSPPPPLSCNLFFYSHLVCLSSKRVSNLEVDTGWLWIVLCFWISDNSGYSAHPTILDIYWDCRHITLHCVFVYYSGQRAS